MKTVIIMMGVAGCGKSSLAQAVGLAAGLAMIEGDDFHSRENREKMSKGISLTDDDRAGWLSALVREIADHPAGCVLSCSALKLAYRERLREAAGNVLFVHLDIEKAEALRRVIDRSAAHFFSANLVDSQFATLESPEGEADVMRVDASLPLIQLQEQVSQRLHALHLQRKTLTDKTE